MIFLCLLLAMGYNEALRPERRVLGSILLGILVLYAGAYTYVLNQNLWRTEEVFFEKEVVLFGNGFYVGDLAKIYHSKGDYPKAAQYYRRAIQEYPNKANLYINYAWLLIDITGLK